MARKGAKGAGTIRKKEVVRGGKKYSYWEARITTGYDPGSGKQIQKSFTGKSQKEVREKMQAAAVALTDGTYSEPSKLSVGEWLDIWEREYLKGVKSSTIQNYNKNIRIHIKPALGAVELRSLSTHTIQILYNSLGESHGGKPGLSPKSIQNVHGVLHKALQQAVEIGYLRFNPSDACKLPRIERKEIQPMDDAAIAAFLHAVQNHQFRAIYLVLLFTGMRRGEALGLMWDCIDLEQGTIFINKQLQNVPGKPGEYTLVSTKNGKGRTIAAAPSVVEILRQCKIRQMKCRLKAGPAWEDSGFVFSDSIGRHLAPSTVYHNFKALVASIGYPNLRLHDLRHSYAVAAIRAGDDIKTVQGNLGHHTAAFTLSTYGHITEEMKRDSADRMEQFIQGISNL